MKKSRYKTLYRQLVKHFVKKLKLVRSYRREVLHMPNKRKENKACFFNSSITTAIFILAKSAKVEKRKDARVLCMRACVNE